MIRWCLSLRHYSNQAYESLRQSNCIKLPSQRTLRDYTYFIKPQSGFSDDIDSMLIHAADVKSNELSQHVIILVDEMHIRQDLVYDKVEIWWVL